MGGETGLPPVSVCFAEPVINLFSRFFKVNRDVADGTLYSNESKPKPAGGWAALRAPHRFSAVFPRPRQRCGLPPPKKTAPQKAPFPLG